MTLHPPVRMNKKEAQRKARNWVKPVWHPKATTGVDGGEVHRSCVPVLEVGTGVVLGKTKCFYCDYSVYAAVLGVPDLMSAVFPWDRERQKAVDSAGCAALFWHFYGDPAEEERCAVIINGGRIGCTFDRPLGFRQCLSSELDRYMRQLWPTEYTERPWVRESDGRIVFK